MNIPAVFSSAVIAFWLLTVPDSHATEKGSIDLAVAYDYSEGNYGGISETRIHYFPFSLTYKTFPWKYKITVPYINISGPGNVIGGADGGIVIGTETEGRISEHGIGDTIVSTTYSADDHWGTAPFVDITAKIKLPTADSDKFLGTGETDYSFQLDVANIYSQYTPFATLGYKIVGDPKSISYNNRLFGTIGLNYKLSDLYSTGVLFDYRQAIVDTVEDQKEGVAYLNWKPVQHLSIMGYLVSGFSDGSPDSGLGLQIKYSP